MIYMYDEHIYDTMIYMIYIRYIRYADAHHPVRDDSIPS